MNEIDDAEFSIEDSGRDAVLAALLRRHPSAVIAALDIEGRMVDLPASLDVDGQQTVRTPSPLDLVKAHSRAALYGSWDRVKRIGVAMIPVELVNGVEASCYLIDVRHRHGVLVGLAVADEPIDLVDALGRLPGLTSLSERPCGGR